MITERVKPIAINYTRFVSLFATNVANTVHIESWWYEDIACTDPAQRNSDLPHAYISVVNKSSQWMFSSLTV
jgi:hypothetical protein